MEKIDNYSTEQIGEYILNAFNESGPYHIESWPLYQLNFEPTEEMKMKAERVLEKMEFTENDEYMIFLRAKKEHIRNFILNNLMEIYSDLEKYYPVLQQARDYNPDEDNSI